MRCAAYTRKTPWKGRLDLEKYTLEKQTEEIATYIKKRGWSLVRSYNDEEGHEALAAMQTDGLSKKFDCVVYASIYFAAGDFLLVTQKLQDTLFAAGVQFAVADENFYSGEHTYGETADYFEQKRRLRHYDITKSWKESKGDGFVLSNSIPYGYIQRVGEDRIEIDEELRPIITEMFRMRMQGIRPGIIAEWLNKTGVDTPAVQKKKRYNKSIEGMQNLWHTDMVTKTMSSPVYTGAKVNNQKQVVKELCFEAYITKEQFDELFPGKYKYAEGMQPPRKQKRGKQDRRLAVYCTECGKRMAVRNETYRCNCLTVSVTMPVESVEQQVMASLESERILAEEAAGKIKEGIAETARITETEMISYRMKTVLAQTELENLQRVPLYDAFKDGVITAEEYETALSDMRESYKLLDDMLSYCIEERSNTDKAYSLKNPWIMLFTAPVQGTDREIMQKSTERVEIKPDGKVMVTVKESEWKEKLLQALKESD